MAKKKTIAELPVEEKLQNLYELSSNVRNDKDDEKLEQDNSLKDAPKQNSIKTKEE